ncbi:hypothetical protein RKI04_24830 [Citrobacter amalonaticus]|uniref:hypothetical protein n=1 Tax=Citrobacter amalonaticus TaxID=35703 RepID=UPI0028794C09|nr:hypothetical protein [Citrobacter amalonaticus]MDS4039454.1 hypothetical protein [Citrobacter amalonaticus]
MNSKPQINAGEMTDHQAGSWLKKMTEAAENMSGSGPLRFVSNRLPSIAGDLHEVLSDVSNKITYLESMKTARSVDQTILAQEDLRLLLETSQSIRSCLQAIETCLVPLRENLEKHWCLLAQGENQESSAPATEGSD